jgi:hypothetical protein
MAVGCTANSGEFAAIVRFLRFPAEDASKIDATSVEICRRVRDRRRQHDVMVES